MRYFLDTEFNERADTPVIDLISVAVVGEDGSSYYAVSSEFDEEACNPWVREHVLPALVGTARKPRRQIAGELVAFVGPRPEFWGWYADYDWVLVCQLFGPMVKAPPGWPRYCRDLKQWADAVGGPRLPAQRGGEHHALADARHLRVRFEALTALVEGRRARRRQWLDPRWRETLRYAVTMGAYAALDFERCFGVIGAARVLGHDRQMWLDGTSTRTAWYTPGGIKLSVGTGVRAAPGGPVEFNVMLPYEDLADFGGLGRRGWRPAPEEAALAEVLAEVLGEEAAVADAAALATRGALTLRHRIWALAAEMALEVSPPEVPSEAAATAELGDAVRVIEARGKRVAVRQGAYALGLRGMAATDHLDADGWHVRGHVGLSMVLYADSARLLPPASAAES